MNRESVVAVVLKIMTTGAALAGIERTSSVIFAFHVGYFFIAVEEAIKKRRKKERGKKKGKEGKKEGRRKGGNKKEIIFS
jgi:hypothetical protein